MSYQNTYKELLQLQGGLISCDVQLNVEYVTITLNMVVRTEHPDFMSLIEAAPKGSYPHNNWIRLTAEKVSALWTPDAAEDADEEVPEQIAREAQPVAV